MEFGKNAWSRSRPELTAPESYVLIYGPTAGGSRPLKLALMELIAGRRLALLDARDRGPLGLWKRSVALLAPGRDLRPPESRSLTALLDLLAKIPPKTTLDGKSGVPVTEFVREALRKYGWPGGYAESEVAPSLSSRGLYQHASAGFRATSGWKLTRAGEAAQADLERGLELRGKRLSLWVDEDPSQALAYLGIAGSSMMLMKELHPDLRRLHEQQVINGGFGVEGGGSEAPPEDLFKDIDLGALGFDLGALEGLDNAFSTIGSTISGGGGGGCDGGGGGGGSGGC